MSSMLDAPPVSPRSARLTAMLGTVGVHCVFVLGATLLGAQGVVGISQALAVTEMVDVDLPEPPKAAEPAPPLPEVAKLRSRHPPAVTAAPPAPPAAAQAGQVLDAAADAVDFGDTFVTGAGPHYAGGTSDGAGKSTVAVRDSAARGSAPSAALSVAPVVDLSRPPQLAGGSQWQCPFPVEADDAGIDRAVVALRIEVAADGRVRQVTALSDPGSGFAREARRCASSKRWSPGLDRFGRTAPAVAVVNVRFDR